MFSVRKKILAISAAAALFICTAMVCALWPLNIEHPASARSKTVEFPAPTVTSPSEEASADLKLLDVDLRRPLVDAPAATAANALAAAATDHWRLVGTSVDSARPMALLMSPDGTTHWFAMGEKAEDGMQVKHVSAVAASIVVNGHAVELKLPPTPPDPLAVEGSAP